ncbi:glycosyltransferase family 2 protein [Phenylobacterium sp.]|uniref:glycosyltransferase family 2 protein n=1 Tax=Phenylobacterium sp. TaxID=1871053 RepID=UPI00120A2EB0|nr:glycosyltransferase family 2 protein [Phenylobacterium sp.]THD63287.1 MAG: glycosyltransferase family 2 protein [Phenylobacterium sp.]
MSGDAGSALELTILMPCLNEAETLAVCIEKAQGFLKRTGISGEVLIADNGSTDGSQAIAAGLGARVVAIPRRGYGAALIGGIEAALGRYVIFGDADDSYDFERLDPFVERLRAGKDVVMGNRFKGGIAPGAMPFLHKYLGNPVLTAIGRLLFKVPAGDFHCGLRGFNTARIRELHLNATGMEFASEFVVRAALASYSIDEVPTTLKPDGRSRPPHLRTWRDGWRHLRFLLLYSPSWLFLFPGLVLIAIGVLGGLVLLPGPVRVARHVTLDTHTLLATSISVIVGIQFVTASVLARRYGILNGLLPDQTQGLKLGARASLESLLLIGGALFVLGGIGVLYGVISWALIGFGRLEGEFLMRVMIISMTLAAAGLQLATLAFLTGLIEIPVARRPVTPDA